MLKRIGIFAAGWAMWALAVTVLMVLPILWPPSVLLWLVPVVWWIWENGIRR